MVYYCGSCGKKIYDSHEASILCVKCKLWIHQDCADLTDQQLDAYTNSSLRRSYTCDKCRDIITSKKSNKHRQRSQMASKADDSNLKDLFRSLEEKLHTSLTSLKEEIKADVVREVAQLREESAKVQGILAGWEEKLKIFKEEVNGMVTGELATLKEENAKLKSEIDKLAAKSVSQDMRLDGLQEELQMVVQKADEGNKSLDAQMEGHNMHSRKNNLEIHGIFEQDKEDPYDLVCAVANHLKVKCSGGDLVAAHRIPTRKPGAVKPLIAHFVCNWKKQEVLAAWRERSRNRNLPTTQDIGIEKNGVPPNNIYINEQLTAINKGLHKRARDLRPQIKFVWTDAGKVLVRETERSAIVHVKNSVVMSNLESKFKSTVISRE